MRRGLRSLPLQAGHRGEMHAVLARMQPSEATEVQHLLTGPTHASLLCGAGSGAAHCARPEQLHRQSCCCLVAKQQCQGGMAAHNTQANTAQQRQESKDQPTCGHGPGCSGHSSPTRAPGHRRQWPGNTCCLQSAGLQGQAWCMAPTWCEFTSKAPTADRASAHALPAHQRPFAKLPSPKSGAQQCLHYFGRQNRRFGVNSLQKGGLLYLFSCLSSTAPSCTCRDSATHMFWVAKCRFETALIASWGSSNTHQLPILCHPPSKDNSLHGRLFHKVWQVVTEAAHTGQTPDAAAAADGAAEVRLRRERLHRSRLCRACTTSV